MEPTPIAKPTALISIPEPEKSSGRQHRLAVAQSHASSLLAHSDNEDEIREAARPIALDIHAALVGWHHDNTALADMDEDFIGRWIDEHIRGFMALTMGRYSPEARQEFSDQVAAEFAKVPLFLLTDAVTVARRKVRFPQDYVPFVFEYIEERWFKFEAEGIKLEKLKGLLEG